MNSTQIAKLLHNATIGSQDTGWLIEKANVDALFLRRKSHNTNQNGVLRIIPTPVVERIYSALQNKEIVLSDIKTGKGDDDIHLFDKLKIMHDRYLSGYASTIKSICKKIDEIATAPLFPPPPSGNLYSILSGSLNSQLTRSLLSKPFVILTGASGTGKTKQAKELAEHFSNAEWSNFEIVAVGADWTDNRSTLGFVNYLTGDGKPVYQSTAILNLLMRANQDDSTPYFLILDEMNLSHVERYFADFLSVMEQREKGSFQLHNEGSSLPNSAENSELVPESIPYPRNLFVIGTVNIDETTYMFSPKVLDRANVIEYKVAEQELAAFLSDPQEPQDIEKAAEGEHQKFLSLALATRGLGGELEPLKDSTTTEINKVILDLFKLMQDGRYEFAYRTANEITRYLRVSRHLAENKNAWDEEEWKASLDEQIVQKILPKLHGSIGRVGKLLAKLAHYTHNPMPLEGVSDRLADVNLLEGAGAYPTSFAKLKQMTHTLKEEQFVSFI